MMSLIQELAARLRQSISQHILGKDDIVDKVTAALLCGGHVLLQDIPGTGKTTLARALAQAMDATFHRIQFTPDLLPSDLLGVSIPDPKTGAFQFHPGAVFTQILLADEINRATPRTQSALLECMAEGQVTVDGTTYPLDDPFFVIATQNPVEMQGTFPLPEAQLDRFLLCLSLGYLDREQELALLSRPAKPESPMPGITTAQLAQARRQLETIRVSDAVREYIVDLARASREHPEIRLGLSTRGTQALYRLSCAMAAIQGRDFVTPDDVKAVAADCMAHRMVPRQDLWNDRVGHGRTLVEQLLGTVPVPKESQWS